MKEEDVAYIAGVVDSIGLFRVNIEEDSEYKTGYNMTPVLRIHRSEHETAALGLIDEYCEENHIRVQIHDKGTSIELEINKPDALRQFLEPLMPYLVQKQEIISIFMGEIVPAVEQKEHHSKQGFYEIIKRMDAMYRNDPSINKWKYKTQFFSNKWRDEIET
jgi:hypothetical protein